MQSKEVNLTREEMESMAKEAITIWWTTVVKAMVMSSRSEGMSKILHDFLSSAVAEMVKTHGSKKTLEMMSSDEVEWTGLIEGASAGELVIHLRATGASFGEAQDALDEFVKEMIHRMASSGEHFEQGSNLLLPA